LLCLERDDVLENIKQFPSDFETFHSIQNNLIIYDNYEQISVQCYSCKEFGHIARLCPKTHCVFEREAVIRLYIQEQKRFMKNFRRKNRHRFNWRGSLQALEESAKWIQDDYGDRSLSEDELSQDSLDLILEKNLILVPNAEINDMKSRRGNDNRRKSKKFTVDFNFFQEIDHINNMLGDKISDESIEIHARNDHLYFNIDRVENFELYFPHNNIQHQIRDLEKRRLEKIENTADGKIKSKFFKSLNVFRRNKVNPGVRRRARFENNVPLINPLQSDMNRMRRFRTMTKDKEGAKPPSKPASVEDNSRHKPKSGASIKDDRLSSDLLMMDERALSKPEHSRLQLIKEASGFAGGYMNKINSNLSIRIPSQSVSKNVTSSLYPSHISNDLLSPMKLTNSIKLGQVSISDIPVTPGETFREPSSLPKVEGSTHRKRKKELSQVVVAKGGSSIDIETKKRFSVDYNATGTPLRKQTSNETPLDHALHKIWSEKEKMGLSLEDLIMISLIRVGCREQHFGRYDRSASYSKILTNQTIFKKFRMNTLAKKLSNEMGMKPGYNLSNLSNI
jgi:hypothetical protein